VSGAEIAERARGLVGVPWRAGGRTIWGLDCGGVVELATGRPVPVRGPATEPGIIRELLAAAADEVRLEEAAAGDVLLLRVGRHPGHLAVLTQAEPPLMVHAYQGARVVAEHPLDEHWRDRVVAVYRVRGL